MLKKFALLSIVAVMLAAGVGMASADGGGINDGRINTFDVASGIAIYYTYDDGYVTDEDGNQVLTEVITGIEAWYATEAGNGVKLFELSDAQIDKAVSASSSTTVVIGGGHGYYLGYDRVNEAFYVYGPNYLFQWDDHYEVAG
ncbi:MAG: hypothetical protein DPW16_07665 [Chloroflexi bacterium]|nr:hypothetical protein [Chloroflexota bacterium]